MRLPSLLSPELRLRLLLLRRELITHTSTSASKTEPSAIRKERQNPSLEQQNKPKASKAATQYREERKQVSLTLPS